MSEDVTPTAAEVGEAIRAWGRDDPRTQMITRLRVAALVAAEATNDTEWWWLSFANDEEFLGLVLIKAGGLMSAVSATHMLGINPGGQVAGWPLPGIPDPPERYVYRLLDRTIAEFLAEGGLTEGDCDCHPDCHDLGVHAPVSDDPKAADSEQ
jgi:hypothetical protein